MIDALTHPHIFLLGMGFVFLLGFSRLRAGAFLFAALLAFAFNLISFESFSSTPIGFFDLDFHPTRRFFGGLVSFLALIVGFYSHSYFSKDPRAPRFFGLLGVFTWSCLLLIYADHALLFVSAWELTSLMSFLLISFDLRSLDARKGAFQALVVTGFGGLSLLGGLILFAEATGSYRISEMIASSLTTQSTPSLWVLALFLLAVMTKSAQFPFHFWLPGAMKAPTPVSAFLHSASLVKLGVFFAALFWPVLKLSAFWHVSLSAIGLFTFAYGAVLSLRQKELKAGLAYTTFSQLGLILCLLAQRSEFFFSSAFLLIMAHALYKCALFLSVGVIQKTCSHHQIHEVSGLAKRLPQLSVIVGLSVASMMGIPFTLGFFGKEAALEIFFGNFQNERARIFSAICLALGSVATISYAVYFFLSLFTGRSRGSFTALKSQAIVRSLWPLPLLGVILGFAPAVLNFLIQDFLGRTREALSFPFSHGLNRMMLISLLLLALGIALGWRLSVRNPLLFLFQKAKWLKLFSIPNRGLTLLWEGLPASGKLLGQKIDELSQKRALFLSLVVSVVALIPLLSHFVWPSFLIWAPGYWQLSLVLLSAAFVALLSYFQKNVGVQILLIGFVGYLVAFAFAIFEAPDLVLTQVLVESASLVFLVLAFRASRLRDGTQRLVKVSSLSCWLLSALMAFCLLSLFSSLSLLNSPKLSSLYFFENAVDLAGGSNLVNVILVDFRAMDTLGEITVLALAFLGSSALTRRKLKRFTTPRPHPYLTDWMKSVGRIFYYSLVGVSLFFLLRGHDFPGGGFIGGLFLALALFLRMMLKGKPAYSLPLTLIGLSLAYLYALHPLILGTGDYFESQIFRLFPSSLIFDIGVFMVVGGSVAGMMKFLLFYLARKRDYWSGSHA